METKDRNEKADTTGQESQSFGRFGRGLVHKLEGSSELQQSHSSSSMDSMTYSKAILGTVAIYTTSKAFEINSASGLP